MFYYKEPYGIHMSATGGKVKKDIAFFATGSIWGNMTFNDDTFMYTPSQANENAQ